MPTTEVDDLPAPLRVYLDALRVVAALWVMLSHFRGMYLASAEIAPLLPVWGHDAVIVFFVLSGLVIAHSHARKRSSLADYALDRAARIYSVVLPILFGAWFVELASTLLSPAPQPLDYQLRKPWIYVPLHLLFLGEIWSLREVPNLITPYWSLNFEVWYYALFAVLVFYRGVRRLVLATAILALLGPQHVLMSPLWLAGVLLWWQSPRRPLGATAARALFVTTLFAYAVMEVAGLDRRLTGISIDVYTGLAGHAPGNARNFLADYVLAILVMLNIHAFRWSGWRIPDLPSRLIVQAAGYSFTLYLLHMPLMVFARRALGSDVPALGTSLALLGALLIATVAVGELTEKRRAALRPPLARLVARLDAAIGARPRLRCLLAPTV